MQIFREPSNVNTPVKVATMAWTLTATSEAPPVLTPMTAEQMTDVRDAHAAVLQTMAASDPLAVASLLAKLTPVTVRSPPDVNAVLQGATKLTIGAARH